LVGCQTEKTKQKKMGSALTKQCPPPPQRGVFVKSGPQTRLCVAGFGLSHHTGRARKIVDSIVNIYPETYESWYYFDSFKYRSEFLPKLKAELSEEQQQKFASHKSSPFCWIERENEKPLALGGRDRLCDWVIANFPKDDEKNSPILELCREEPSRTWNEVFFDNSTPGTAKTEH
jgi:hypothetical protein